MYKLKKVLTLRTLTPLHVGTGDSVGIVDLPIQREKHTNFPKIEGSSLKGALREAFEDALGEDKSYKIQRVFGIDSDSIYYNEAEIRKIIGLKNDERLVISGAISISDAFPLLFPVKSAKGVFGLVTCPQILQRFSELLELAEYQNLNFEDFNDFIEALEFDEDKSTLLGYTVSDSDIVFSDKIVLEDLTFEYNDEASEVIGQLSNVIIDIFQLNNLLKKKVKKSLVIVSNDMFRDFVTSATEVITRVKIDDKLGTVAQGALWTEEYLPSETFLISGLFIANEFSKSANKLIADEVYKFLYLTVENKLNNTIQLGGNTTIGKGITKIKIY